MVQTIEKQDFGIHEDGPVNKYTLSNKLGMEVSILNYGGIIQSIRVPDRDGHLDDIVLGFDSLEGYMQDQPYLGAIIGRFCNRIAHGKFQIDNQDFQVTTNAGKHILHGGNRGFDKYLWDVTMIEKKDLVGVSLKRLSPHMEEGFPGNLQVVVNCTLNKAGRLEISYLAETDAPTVINLTNHTYFNLEGHRSPHVFDQELQIFSTKITDVDDSDLIPNGKIKTITNTALDFTTAKPIGQDIHHPELLELANGFDHNYVLNQTAPGRSQRAARVSSKKTGRTMEVWTTEPCMQLYTNNCMDGYLVGKDHIRYGKHSAFCLETQHAPDAPNHVEFDSTILRPGQQFVSRTAYTFGLSN